MYFPISYDHLSDLSDWEILSAHLYIRLMIERKTQIGKDEYLIFLESFSGDKESLDAWLYKLTKLYENEFYKRHTN